MAEVISENIQDQAQLALASSPIYELRDLHVEHVGETLLISGRVESYYYKQLAQELVRAVVDLEVINTISVR